jgi:NAD(P)-dependent dehydrogenase (short-subunit alcohol dehydrogenase family)
MLVDLSEDALKQAVEELGHNVASYCVGDVTKSADTIKYAAATIEKFGGVDILQPNAGIEGAVGPLADYDEDEFDRVMAVNVKGVWLGLKHTFPEMEKRGAGSIVITSSVAGVMGTPMLSAYGTSKHAVIGLMRAAAKEGGAHKICVNTVNPSPVEGQMMRRIETGLSPDDGDVIHDAFKAEIPLQSYADLDDIANNMLFLASDEAKFLTGGVYMTAAANQLKTRKDP